MVGINTGGKRDVILIVGQCLPLFMFTFTKFYRNLLKFASRFNLAVQ